LGTTGKRIRTRESTCEIRKKEIEKIYQDRKSIKLLMKSCGCVNQRMQKHHVDFENHVQGGLPLTFHAGLWGIHM
jgi:hypothetical protein